jgi:hypothetical protein
MYNVNAEEQTQHCHCQLEGLELIWCTVGDLCTPKKTQLYVGLRKLFYIVMYLQIVPCLL